MGVPAYVSGVRLLLEGRRVYTVFLVHASCVVSIPGNKRSVVDHFPVNCTVLFWCSCSKARCSLSCPNCLNDFGGLYSLYRL